MSSSVQFRTAHFVGRPLLHIGLHEVESLTVWAHVVVGIDLWRHVRDDSWHGRAEAGWVVTPTLMILFEWFGWPLMAGTLPLIYLIQGFPLPGACVVMRFKTNS